ncbi:MAG: cupin domain-containing protein [Deltaproteobacteria bacterium]|nr:MAG: cupin domain-containing protein [Deltaproteobacteria bacterium]
MDETGYIPGDIFHAQLRKVYFGELDWAVNKKGGLMAHVLYLAPHENAAESGERRGRGKDFAKWIFAEEPGLEEKLFSTRFELAIDARLEPGAAIGLHFHDRTEEIYYLLEGELTMTTVERGGRELSAVLRAGDAHLVKLGQGHFGVAGSKGARFVAFAVRA